MRRTTRTRVAERSLVSTQHTVVVLIGRNFIFFVGGRDEFLVVGSGGSVVGRKNFFAVFLGLFGGVCCEDVNWVVKSKEVGEVTYLGWQGWLCAHGLGCR